VKRGEIADVEADEYPAVYRCPSELRLVVLAEATGLWDGDGVESGGTERRRCVGVNVLIRELR
jgi:hypothetical protein